ncbi:MAG: Shedu anti-phage system protein SduA domain-containing protein [Patescibacteria group bacterium]
MGLSNTLENWQKAGESPVFGLFDLTSRDLSSLVIQKTYHEHCVITDSRNYFKGFILNKKTGVQTVCEITFHPSSVDGLYTPRLTFSKCTIPTGEAKISKNPEKVIVSFNGTADGLVEFWKMIGFLSKFKELVDVGEFDRSYKVTGADDIVLKLKEMPEADRIKQILDYATQSNIKVDDLTELAIHVNRKSILKVFEDLLNKEGYIDEYRTLFLSEIKGMGDEAVWHHFLSNNNWLLGLNLDIRFIDDFTSETSVGNPNTDDVGNPKVDLMGLSDYTVLVELKTSETKIFTATKTSKSRAGTWSFTQDFIEGFSQCLVQKSDWDKNSKGKDLMKDGEVLDQTFDHRTVDPKTIFIIGNKEKEFSSSSRKADDLVKRDTFERFRRNNRNVEILTYDELYKRADFIVNDSKKKIVETVPAQPTGLVIDSSTEEVW